MIAFKLAYKNLIGAGLRTLLIVFVLSLAYVLIIYMNGLYQVWDHLLLHDLMLPTLHGGFPYRLQSREQHDLHLFGHQR